MSNEVRGAVADYLGPRVEDKSGRMQVHAPMHPSLKRAYKDELEPFFRETMLASESEGGFGILESAERQDKLLEMLQDDGLRKSVGSKWAAMEGRWSGVECWDHLRKVNSLVSLISSLPRLFPLPFPLPFPLLSLFPTIFSSLFSSLSACVPFVSPRVTPLVPISLSPRISFPRVTHPVASPILHPTLLLRRAGVQQAPQRATALQRSRRDCLHVHLPAPRRERLQRHEPLAQVAMVRTPQDGTRLRPRLRRREQRL